MKRLRILLYLVQVKHDYPFIIYASTFFKASDNHSLGDELMDEESWIFLNETVGGSQVVDQPIIAFRKRVDSKRQDHITQVSI